MASSTVALLLALTIAIAIHSNCSLAQTDKLVQQQSSSLNYHKGPLLTGKVSLNLIWYGIFKPSQRAIVSDFIYSLSAPADGNPNVATWWKGIKPYYASANSARSSPVEVSIGSQISDESYSMGKKLTIEQITKLAAKGGSRSSINVVLTSADVAVDGFCSIKCGSHGSLKPSKVPYIWVGNAEAQCPGHCAWPFHKPIYGPQSPALIAPNNDVGVDGMVTNLASLLVGTVTNPYGNGYFQGSQKAPLEASSACTGVYGRGAYPGYAGELLVDGTSGASYNARGVNGRKYLLPALMNPGTSTCTTLV